jgi:hypothetical protein
MIVRFKFYKSFYNFLIIMIPNLLSVFGQNFNTDAELESVFLFLQLLLCGPASCDPLGSGGLQQERYHPIYKSCLQNHLTLVHLTWLDTVTYSVYNTLKVFKGLVTYPALFLFILYFPYETYINTIFILG